MNRTILAAISVAAVLSACVTYTVVKLSGPKEREKQTRADGDGPRCETQAKSDGNGQPQDSEEPMRLIAGKRYRMMVIAARLPDRKPNGKEWDYDFGSNLPDPYFILRTPDHYYKSPVVRDCLAPNWADKIDFDPGSARSGRVRVANEGALFVYSPGSRGRFHLEFWDSDVLADDEMGSITFSMDEIKPGITQWEIPAASMVFTLRIIPDGL